jgi:hypothetical protein
MLVKRSTRRATHNAQTRTTSTLTRASRPCCSHCRPGSSFSLRLARFACPLVHRRPRLSFYPGGAQPERHSSSTTRPCLDRRAARSFAHTPLAAPRSSLASKISVPRTPVAQRPDCRRSRAARTLASLPSNPAALLPIGRDWRAPIAFGSGEPGGVPHIYDRWEFT